MPVEALMRTLSVSRSYDDLTKVGAAPTYQTRDGKADPRNRAFWQATPSGELELKLTKDSEAADLFEPGSYFVLRFHESVADLDQIDPPGPEWVRSYWQLDKLTVGPDWFSVALSTLPGNEVRQGNTWAWIPGRNRALLGLGRAGHGTMSLQINNLEAWPFFAFEPRKGSHPRIFVVDIRRD